MHPKFMELGMHVPHLIPDVLTKWHTQIQHTLAVISEKLSGQFVGLIVMSH
jgi:hypothetical protein